MCRSQCEQNSSTFFKSTSRHVNKDVTLMIDVEKISLKNFDNRYDRVSGF